MIIERDLAQEVWARLRQVSNRPASVIDPQSNGTGLISAFPFTAARYTIAPEDPRSNTNHLKGDCREAGRILSEVYPDAVWECGVASPIGLNWRTDSPLDWTWQFLQRHTRYGCMVVPASPSAEEMIHHWSVSSVEAFGENRLIYYDTGREVTPCLREQFSGVKEIHRQESGRRVPEFNVWIRDDSTMDARNGSLGVFFPVRDRITLNIPMTDLDGWASLDGRTPQSLTVERPNRVRLQNLLVSGVKIQDEARQAITEAITEAERVSTPIMPVTDFERVAYLDEEDSITCVNSWGPFREGEKYPVSFRSYTFRQNFNRRKPHYNEATGEMETIEHECTLSGQDRKVVVGDYEFMSNPDENNEYQLNESRLWEIFSRPPVITVADRYPERVAEIRRNLEAMEVISDIQYFPGQLEYLSRVLVRDSALIAAETGTGKSLMAISCYVAKGADRCLVVCPKGVASSDSEDEMSQWVEEINRFAPHIECFKLFTKRDYDQIVSLNGELPPGIYVTYYDAFFKNGGMESCSRLAGGEPRWRDDKLAKPLKMTPEDLAELMGRESVEDTHDLIGTVGQERNGIRSIVKPSLSTLVGHHFDMMCLDEAHSIKGMDAQITQAVIRLSPRYRFAFTATPVPNTVADIFPIIGWVCVENWYRGGISNAAFPYRREDFNNFLAAFLSKERDWTAEQMLARSRRRRARRIEKTSPVLASPTRLLKILKPSIAYITKGQCNADYLPPRIVDVRVPMGEAQARLYAHFTQLNRIERTIAGTRVQSPLVRTSAQIEWLRTICTDPTYASSRATDAFAPEVNDPFNPKIAAIMELTANALHSGEQVVIVNARKGITNVIHDLLEEAGVPVSRIDSSERSGNHAEESNLFKRGNTRVMLMGIKCAVGHSYAQCKNLIIGSLEYSPGPFEQAKGRVDRLTSKEARIYCILCRNSIEEVMFDTVAMKDDASKIILRGQRVPRDFVPVDMSEVLMDSIIAWNGHDENTIPEAECGAQWEALKERMTSET